MTALDPFELEHCRAAAWGYQPRQEGPAMTARDPIELEHWLHPEDPPLEPLDDEEDLAQSEPPADFEEAAYHARRAAAYRAQISHEWKVFHAEGELLRRRLAELEEAQLSRERALLRPAEWHDRNLEAWHLRNLRTVGKTVRFPCGTVSTVKSPPIKHSIEITDSDMLRGWLAARGLEDTVWAPQDPKFYVSELHKVGGPAAPDKGRPEPGTRVPMVTPDGETVPGVTFTVPDYSWSIR